MVWEDMNMHKRDKFMKVNGEMMFGMEKASILL